MRACPASTARPARPSPISTCRPRAAIASIRIAWPIARPTRSTAARTARSIIDETCIGCGNCQRNCPYGVIRMDKVPPKKPNLLLPGCSAASAPARASRRKKWTEQAGQPGDAQEGDQVRHVLGHRGRPGLRPRLPDRRRDPRRARGVPHRRADGRRGLAGWRAGGSSAPTIGEGTSHEGFLRHRDYRWLKIARRFCAVAILAYLLIDVEPRPNGGSWYGYTLGTIGALLILWLTALGVRKRAITRKRWSLKAWTSAHVYLGLSLIVIATLHTGFQFGWNIHTLAYVLMMLVILSGIYGISAYAFLPAALSDNRSRDDRRADDRRGREHRQADPDLGPAALRRGQPGRARFARRGPVRRRPLPPAERQAAQGRQCASRSGSSAAAARRSARARRRSRSIRSRC